MENGCVLAVEEGSVINRALEKIMVESNTKFTVVPYKAKTVRELISKTASIKPDVFFLGESTKLASKDTLGYLLMSFPNLRVVIVSEGSNWLHVIHKKDTLLQEQADLIDAVFC